MPILTASPSIRVTLIWIVSPITIPSFTFLDRINILRYSFLFFYLGGPEFFLGRAILGQRSAICFIRLRLLLTENGLSVLDFALDALACVRSVALLPQKAPQVTVARIPGIRGRFPWHRPLRADSNASRFPAESTLGSGDTRRPAVVAHGFAPPRARFPEDRAGTKVQSVGLASESILPFLGAHPSMSRRVDPILIAFPCN